MHIVWFVLAALALVAVLLLDLIVGWRFASKERELPGKRWHYTGLACLLWFMCINSIYFGTIAMFRMTWVWLFASVAIALLLTVPTYMRLRYCQFRG